MFAIQSESFGPITLIQFLDDYSFFAGVQILGCLQFSNTYKYLEMPGTHKPVPSVIPRPTAHQHSTIVFHHFFDRVTLK